ncbi:hypothetical protein BC940DRAFT_291227 [Gongronella butleri]|nr:hypothetical protein BC940DRAFT_291227 [Gongronella butleri]
MFEFPWQWGYCACAFYLLGVVQTLINSNGKTATVMGSTRHDAHVLGMVLVVSPFIVNNGCALSAGFLATTNVFAAEVITRLLYASWVVHCGVLGFFVLLMGFRLLKVVTQHINRVKSKSYDPVHKAKLLASSGKIRAIIYVIFTALASFVLLLCFYSLFRDWIIQTVSVSLFGCILWNYLSTTLTLLASVLFLRSPRRHLNNAHLAHPSSGHDVPQVETTFGEIVTDELMMNESCPSEISSVAMETLQKLRSMAPPLPPPPPLHDPSSSSSFKPSSSSAISSSGKSFSTSQHDFYDSSSSTLVAQ